MWLKLAIRNDDGNGNVKATNQLFDWLNEEKESCCTCGTLLGAFFGLSLPNDGEKILYYFEVLTATQVSSSKSSILCFFMITILAKQGKVHLAYLYNVTNMEQSRNT